MEAYLFDWLSLLGRWLHMITGIAWIGASFYFVWLDNHLEAPQDPRLREAGVSGELWAVHGGGFYNPQKYAGTPPSLPAKLHWFKWEAYTAWMTGMFMLGVVYYAGAGSPLIDRQVADLSPALALCIGLAFLAGGWLIYDQLCKRLASQNRLLALILAVLTSIAAWGLCQLFSGRGAYIHFGAMLGTIMVANVFFVIIPGQRAMVDAAHAGIAPDPQHGRRGKQRSVHNTYFTLPVLFTMISNHYPMTWGSALPWLTLIGIAFAGVAIRIWFVMRHKQQVTGKTSPWPLLAGIAGLIVIALVLRPSAGPDTNTADTPAAQFTKVQQIINARCVVCHAAAPAQPGFATAPKGIRLDTPEQILNHAHALRAQLAARAMPLGNVTNMTDQERSAVIAWIDRGAPH